MSDDLNTGNAATQSPLSIPVLAPLAIFVGTWRWDGIYNGQPFGNGSSRFDWLEGGAFLIEHSDAEQPDFPAGVSIYGADDTTGDYVQIQVDSRGETRIYHMSIAGGVWKTWRNAPGFSQRFSGTFSPDGNTINGRCEKSTDGSTWEYDFDLVYTRQS